MPCVKTMWLYSFHSKGVGKVRNAFVRLPETQVLRLYVQQGTFETS
jgi:hypothetical protein